MWEEGYIGFMWSWSVELKVTTQYDLVRKKAALSESVTHVSVECFLFGPPNRTSSGCETARMTS